MKLFRGMVGIFIIFATAFFGSTATYANTSCVNIFNAEQQNFKAKALLPEAAFVLSDTYKRLKNKTYGSQEFDLLRGDYPRMSEEDAVALFGYTSYLHKDLNRNLASKKYDPFYRQVLVYINSALSYLPVVIKEKLYRGMRNADVEQLSKIAIGEEFVFNEFKSTSQSIQIAKMFASEKDDMSHVMEFINTKSYNLSRYSAIPEELEYLVKPGSRFKLIDIQINDNGPILYKTKKYIVEMVAD